jgi:hypothetical protein
MLRNKSSTTFKPSITRRTLSESTWRPPIAAAAAPPPAAAASALASASRAFGA